MSGRHKHRHPRAGFTMVEIMMVVAVMAVLISLTVVATRNVLGTSRIKATQATIRKIDGLMTRRLEAFERDLEERGASFSNTSANGVQNRKTRLQTFFPQTFTEAGLSAPTDHRADTESAEVLYHFLMNTEALDTEDLDSDMFSTSEVMDTDGDGLPEFVDAWGKPLRFYRWPTRLIRPSTDPTADQEVIRPDMMNPATWYYKLQLDPDFRQFANANGVSARVLISSIPSHSYPSGWPGTPITLGGEQNYLLAKDADDPLGHSSVPGNVAAYEDTIHTPATWSLPLIVSAGLDGGIGFSGPETLGLFEPHDTTNHGHLAQPHPEYLEAILDNITNRNLQSGGQ